MNLLKTHYETVENVISETTNAWKNYERYKPFRKMLHCPSNDQKVKSTSHNIHLIVQSKKNGNFHITTNLFNDHMCTPLGLSHISYTVIYNAIQKVNHKEVRTEKIN